MTLQVMVYASGRMVKSIRDIGNRIKWMAKDNLYGLMGKYMMVWIN